MKPLLRSLVLVCLLATCMGSDFKTIKSLKASTGVGLVQMCGYDNLPMIGTINNNITEEGTISIWDQTVFKFDKTTGIPSLSCFVSSEEIAEDHRYVVLYNQDKTANTFPVLYRNKGNSLEAVEWKQFKDDQYIHAVAVGPNKMLVEVRNKDQSGQFRIYNYADMSKYTTFDPDLLNGPLILLTRLGTMIGFSGIDPTNPKITAYYGADFSQKLVSNISKGNASALQLAFIQERTAYTLSANKAVIVLLYANELSKFVETTIEITYSAEGVPTLTQGSVVAAKLTQQVARILSNKLKKTQLIKSGLTKSRLMGSLQQQIDINQGSWSESSIQDFLAFRIYCQDRLFTISLQDLCVKENGQCAIDQATALGVCTRQHSTGSTKLALLVLDKKTTEVQIKVIEQAEGTNWVLYIIIGVAAVLVLGIVIAFIVLKVKKGLTFGEFVTCKCFRGKSGRDEGYEKM